MIRIKFPVLVTAALFFFMSCSKDDNPGGGTDPVPETPEDGMFVVAVTNSPFGGAHVLHAAGTLDSGVLQTSGTGVEQNGSSRNYISHNGVFFSLLFGQSAPGAVTAYKINAQKQLEKLSDFQTETMTALGIVNDDILLVKNAWEATDEFAKWYRLDTKTRQIVAQGEINANQLVGNGEKAFFTSMQQVGNKVFAPFWSIESARTFRTDYPDSNYVAVFSYPDMKLEKVIRDNRTGALGWYLANGIDVDEQGDAYVLGNKGAKTKQNTFSLATPVAFMKIKKGTTEYDKSYFFNISSASGGKYVYRQLYLGKGNYLLTMGDQPNQYGTTMGSAANGISFAIANVYTATYKPVTGAPAPDKIFRTTEYSLNYSPLDGKTGYLGINQLDFSTFEIKSSVYKFNAETATATQGLTLAGEAGYSSLSWVPVTK